MHKWRNGAHCLHQQRTRMIQCICAGATHTRQSAYSNIMHGNLVLISTVLNSCECKAQYIPLLFAFVQVCLFVILHCLVLVLESFFSFSTPNTIGVILSSAQYCYQIQPNKILVIRK